MGGCSSQCITFTFNIATISPNDYPNCNLSPPVLPVVVNLTNISPTETSYQISLIRTAGNIVVTAVYNNSFQEFTRISQPIPMGVTVDGLNTPFINIFLTQVPGADHAPNDKYHIEQCFSQSLQIFCEFTRSGPGGRALVNTLTPNANTTTSQIVAVSTDTNACLNGCNNVRAHVVNTDVNANGCGNIRVPEVLVAAQTTIDSTDVGDLFIEIRDEFTYYDNKPIPVDNKCEVIFINPDQLKVTRLTQCCPFIVSVLKGKGNTASEKAMYIYDRMSESIGVSFFQFGVNLVNYSMAKFTLSRILYGDFNINYLLGKYNEKFLEDLGSSRFCSFVEYFVDCKSEVFGYNKYFKFGRKAMNH